MTIFVVVFNKVAGVDIGGTANMSEKANLHPNHQERKDKVRKVSYLNELPAYDPERSDKEFKRLELQKLILSKEEFEAAADRDDYQTILASLRSDSVPEVDFTSLFLRVARRGNRDVALLLATRVVDLSTRNEYGNPAICVAAQLGDICFAHHLFTMGVTKRVVNDLNKSLQQIARESSHKHFVKFLLRFKKD